MEERVDAVGQALGVVGRMRAELPGEPLRRGEVAARDGELRPLVERHPALLAVQP
ncbi:hypothetical protein WME91_34525 [Sorangium sp. So ce269]